MDQKSEIFEDADGADWELEGEAYFQVRLDEWPPKPNTSSSIKARFSLGYDGGEQENIKDELNSATIEYRITGLNQSLTNWTKMERDGFDEDNYFIFLKGQTKFPNEDSTLEFKITHPSFGQVWELNDLYIGSKFDLREETLLAIEKGDIDTLLECLNKGVDPNSKYEGVSLLHLAISCKRNEILETLLQHKASLSILDWENFTPLMSACSYGNCEAIKILLKYGAKLNEPVKSENSMTPLMLACCSITGDLDSSVEILLKHGANPNQKDDEGKTAIFYWYNGLKVRLNQKDAGSSFLKLTLKLLFKDLPLVIVANLLNIIGISKLKKLLNSPLSFSRVNNTELKVLNSLLKEFADINARDKQGKTLLDKVREDGCVQVEKLLLSKGAQ